MNESDKNWVGIEEIKDLKQLLGTLFIHGLKIFIREWFFLL